MEEGVATLDAPDTQLDSGGSDATPAGGDTSLPEGGTETKPSGDLDKGDKTETDAPVSSDDLLDILQYRAQKAAKARAAQGQGGQPPAQVAGSQQAPGPPAPPIPIGPFQMDEEMKERFTNGDYEGAFNAALEHGIGQLKASRDDIKDDVVGELQKAMEQTQGQWMSNVMNATRTVARMDRFLEKPENADIAAYDDSVHGAAMQEAHEAMPDAPISKKLDEMARIIRDGIRVHRAVASGKVIDQRPGRTPASDSPRVGGGVPKTQQRSQVDQVTKYWDTIG